VSVQLQSYYAGLTIGNLHNLIKMESVFVESRVGKIPKLPPMHKKREFIMSNCQSGELLGLRDDLTSKEMNE